MYQRRLPPLVSSRCLVLRHWTRPRKGTGTEAGATDRARQSPFHGPSCGMPTTQSPPGDFLGAYFEAWCSERCGGFGNLDARHYFPVPARQNFDAWRRRMAPGAEVPHPALRAGLSRPGEVIHQACAMRLRTAPSNGGGGLDCRLMACEGSLTMVCYNDDEGEPRRAPSRRCRKLLISPATSL